MNDKIKNYRNFSDFIKVELKDPKLALAYLNEAIKSGDEKVFSLALRHVIEARGSISGLKENEEDPKLSSIFDIFKDIGIEVELKWA